MMHGYVVHGRRNMKRQSGNDRPPHRRWRLRCATLAAFYLSGSKCRCGGFSGAGRSMRTVCRCTGIRDGCRGGVYLLSAPWSPCPSAVVMTLLPRREDSSRLGSSACLFCSRDSSWCRGSRHRFCAWCLLSMLRVHQEEATSIPNRIPLMVRGVFGDE